jgi:hypothetical protein
MHVFDVNKTSNYIAVLYILAYGYLFCSQVYHVDKEGQLNYHIQHHWSQVLGVLTTVQVQPRYFNFWMWIMNKFPGNF